MGTSLRATTSEVGGFLRSRYFQVMKKITKKL